MFLRSGKVKKTLFPASASPFLTPQGQDRYSTPVESVREQRERQERRNKEKNMADTVEALHQCCQATRNKVERIRVVIAAANMSHDKFSFHALKLYLKTVDSCYEEFNGFQNRIYLTDASRKAEFEQHFIEFEEVYEFTRIAISEMIQAHEDEQRAAAEASNADRLSQLSVMNARGASQPGGSGSTNAQARIPPSLILQQAPLPTFDGRYDQWFKFKARFRDIVDRCVHDSDATKLHHLDKALIGDAKGAIDEQTLNDNNYDGAWKILIDRYENLPMVIHGHITKLLNLKPMTKESTHELRILVDDCVKRVESLQFHKLRMDTMGEAIIITLLTSKLDPATRKAWELSVPHGTLPAYQDTVAFLRNHCHVLERCEQGISSVKGRNQNPISRPSAGIAAHKTHTVTVQKPDDGCSICSGKHLIDTCETFKNMQVDARYEKAKQLGLCFGCLKRGHRTGACKNKPACPSCTKKHHPLMHYEEKKKPVSTDQPAQSKQSDGYSGNPPLTAAKCVIPSEPRVSKKQILLATAVVKVFDCCGVPYDCRVLLDSGAMTSFISERMANLLNLRRVSANVPIVGVNGMKQFVKFKICAKVASKTTNDSFLLECLVVPRVTGPLPATKIDSSSWPIPDALELADPRFYEPSRIDMLIGAEMFFELIQAGKCQMSPDLPVLQESSLGWLVGGKIAGATAFNIVKVCHAKPTEVNNEQLSELLKRFWIVDNQQDDMHVEFDEFCEDHFMRTHTRTPEGRYGS